jgi:hypothetical protein
VVDLGSRFHDAALSVLLKTCRELRLPEPTLPPQASASALAKAGRGDEHTGRTRVII